MVQIKKETANEWEYKVGVNANIANFCAFMKTPTLWTKLQAKYLIEYRVGNIIGMAAVYSVWNFIS